MAAGCIGLAKLYPEEDLPRVENGVILNKKVLNSLAEKYISGLIEEFSIVKRDIRRLKWYSHQAEKKPERTKELAVEVRKNMNEQYKKVEKYFSNTDECKRLKDLLAMISEIKNSEDAPKISEAIASYKEIMQTTFINEKLTLNYAKAVVLNPFFGQTSILQPVFNSKSTDEHIAQIEKDFIQPAKLEIDFTEIVATAKTKEDIIDFLEQNHDYKPFKDLIKPFKKLPDLDAIQDYLKNEELPCSFIDGFIATQSYEEMTFSPLSFSKNKAVNFNWNFDKQLPVPISAVARLVMFMAPFGMAFYSRKIGNITSNENLRFSGLFMTQKHFAEVIKENLTYQKLRGEGSSFEEAIVGLLRETVDKANKIRNSYFFLEVYSNYQMKKTLLDYYHMPSYLAYYIAKYGKTLDILHHKDLKDSFFRIILKGIDPRNVVFDYLRVAIAEPFHALGAYYAVRERRRILEAKKGVSDVTKYDKTISYVYYRGADLRKEMVIERSGGQKGEPYRASGRKKIEGIAYRLLNAAKAGNKSAFMDTIFRVHIASGLDVPSVFIEAFKDEGLDFDTISSAFIAGLLGQEKINEKGEVANG